MVVFEMVSNPAHVFYVLLRDLSASSLRLPDCHLQTALSELDTVVEKREIDFTGSPICSQVQRCRKQDLWTVHDSV